MKALNKVIIHQLIIFINRYRRKRPKVDASIFDSVLSHTHRSDASEKKEENSVTTFGRFRMWTSLESSPVSVKLTNDGHFPKANFLKSAKIISVDQACPEFCQNIITRSSNLTRSLKMANFSSFDSFNGQPRVVPGSQEIRGKIFLPKSQITIFCSHSPKN